ncbi:MAG: Germination protein, Ger(X)C family [Desulfotomaculum sp. 46_296]|nr:MAG: Germination protein, Ger(X)C family [Desulfotomaculum sp. 46_296]
MKKAVICLLLLTLLFTGGCWDLNELNSIAIVLGTGIDKTPDGEVELTLDIALPSSVNLLGGGTSPTMGMGNFIVVSEKGKTIYEAQNKINMRLSRRISLGHNLVIIFGKRAAEQGLRDVLNFNYRIFQTREASWVFVSSGEAREIFEKGRPLIERTISQYLDKTTIENGIGVQFIRFVRDIYRQGIEAAVPQITLKKGNLTIGPTGKSEQVPVPDLKGLAVFKGDKLVGFLNEEETKGFRLLRSVYTKQKGMVIAAPGLQAGKELSYEPLRWTIRIDPVQEKNNLKIFVKTDVLGNIVEQRGTENIYNMKTLKRIEQNINGEIERLVQEAIRKAQGEYGTDVFGFGEAYHKKYKKTWPEIGPRWDDMFSNAEIYLDVSAAVRNTGLETSRPVLRKEGG